MSYILRGFVAVHMLRSIKSRLSNGTCGFLLSVLLLLLAGCQSAIKSKTYRIGFSQCTGGDEWRKTMLHDMKRELTFHPNYTLLYEDAENSTARQISQIQTLVDQGIDLLIISPNETAPFTKVIEAVFRKGIPVILLDRKIETEFYNAYIGGDNVEIGRLAGVFIGNHLKGKGRIVEIWGLPSSSPAQERHRGLLEELRKYPGIQVLKELNGQWERDTVGRVVAAELNTLKDVDLVFAHNDVMALGAYAVCKQKGIEKKLDFVGIDALPGPNAGMQAVTDGILKASFLYPTGGEEAIETATRILAGKSVKREQILNSIQIDGSNIRALKTQSDKLLAQQADIEKQSQRIDALTQTYASQKNTLYITLASLFVVMLLGAWALYLFRSKQTAYRTLERQNEEIREQKDKIEAVSQQARLATEEKLRFYSYISHEFNTPLSLILTPTEDLLTKKTVSSHDLKSNLALIQKNAYRLLRLIDQMLDLRKTDAGKQRLRTVEQDLVAFIQDIVQDFKRKAEKQRIDLQFMPSKSSLLVWFDNEKLDKVIVNLLSNAFKYTPKGGLIHIRLDVRDNQVWIQVEDNGEGMTPDEQAHAFDLFFSGTRPFNLSKGLGLALSMEFIQLHQGEVSVKSEKDKGTTFTILLPLGRDHLAEEEMDQSGSRNTLREGAFVSPRLLVDVEEEESTIPTDFTQKRSGTLLVVEDNDDIRTFLTTRLGHEFEIIAESTGEKGWERAIDVIPDLIISDIMLPGMDGMQLTQRVKADLRTSHIPVVLLTAKGQMEQRIEGTRAGADAYITKPFNTTYLLEVLRTTLANREKWQRRYASDFLSQAGAGNRQDKKFLNELTGLIEQNLTDPDFGVEKLSRDMGLSRVQLYRKVQALLDMNVIDYVAEIRLKKARRLLTESTKTMAEIAYETGFSSPAYFTTFFKQHTQKTPSEYRKSPASA
ncbi:substrate-binding domain-containing protein [Spirosoma sp.]|uniref:substrate-binding domain-containing protein n=1 Tax=Spirosoma sp. TaxID=1899569 RepID=UPI002630D4FE|nr:substrate-binding domain-containing protein [Spirosoma sp.]MCX6216875.1 substrate-binding domain-containing protein [Spirosoma sp.]